LDYVKSIFQTTLLQTIGISSKSILGWMTSASERLCIVAPNDEWTFPNQCGYRRLGRDCVSITSWWIKQIRCFNTAFLLNLHSLAFLPYWQH
jgi:hypothetical protein